jgi:phage head maturation protease
VTPSDAKSILPHKTFDVEFKDVDEASGSFTMYAAIFGNVDRQGDVIDPGAFDNLPEFVESGWIALNHDQASLPMAIVETASQAVKCSIGYVTNDESFERLGSKNVRRIKKLSVYEASFVNLPANPAAEVQSVKSEGQSMNGIEDKASVIDAFKELILSLDRKGDAPKSAYTHLKAYAEAIHEHGTATREHSKAMNEHGKAACEMAKAMKTTLKLFTSGQQQDVDDDNDGNTADKDKEADPKEPDEDDKPEPKKKKEEDEEDKTKKAYAAQLRRRALLGRHIEVCP